ncbi:hypothetical protein ACIGCM_12755 [Pseudomonas sp. NPDC078700]|uniref:hypothetical protein n=1 Tax=Pseudomonas sp. NPDC078700 TaxID=3364424 RepID=UPI0037C94DE2
MNSLNAAVLFADTDAPLGQDLPLNASFVITTEVESEILCRLLSYFTQLGLVPLSVVACQHNGCLQVSIQQLGLSVQRANVIAQKMRSLVSVFQVELQMTKLASENTAETELGLAEKLAQVDAYDPTQNHQVEQQISQFIAG